MLRPISFFFSHKEMAAHIEGLAGEALKVSTKTYSILLDLLGDNSTERHLQALTEQWVMMHVCCIKAETLWEYFAGAYEK